MSFDPRINRNNKDAIGDPGDLIATNTSEPWTMISLLKGLLNGFLGGISVTPSQTDDAAFTPGTTKVLPVAGTYRLTRDALDDGDAGAIALNAKRGVYVTLEAADSTPIALNAGAASAATIRTVSATDDPVVTLLTAISGNVDGLEGFVDGLEALTGAVTETAPATDTASSGLNGRMQRIAQQLTTLLGAGATTIAKAEDAASADADVGVPAMAVRKATPANTSGADGDYEFVQMANGRIWVRGIVTDVNDVPFLSAANALNSTGAGVLAAQLVGQFDDTSPTAITENQFGNLRMSANRNLFQTLRDAAGNERGANVNANNALSVFFDQTTAGTTNGVVPHATAATGGIASTSRIVSAAASTNGTSAKASAGRVYSIQGYNAATSVRYLKLYNKASSPTVGSDTPVKTLALPPGVGFAFDWPHGYSFATGIAYALTTGSADADTGALTAADVVGLNVDYV